jgi:hypothetical protein
VSMKLRLRFARVGIANALYAPRHAVARRCAIRPRGRPARARALGAV